MAKTPSTLALLCKQFVMKPAYPKDVLVAAVAKCHHIENIGEWEWRSSIPVIQRYEDTAKDHTIYCYPEYNQEQNSIAPKLLDLTHLLTNMRVHVTTKNMVDSTYHFLRVSQFDDKILDRPTVSDLMDKQSAKQARKVFSEDVQKVMEMFEKADEAKNLQSNSKPSSNVVKTSQFVKGIWNRYNACDTIGYTPAERINMMQDFYDLLTCDVDFS